MILSRELWQCLGSPEWLNKGKLTASYNMKGRDEHIKGLADLKGKPLQRWEGCRWFGKYKHFVPTLINEVDSFTSQKAVPDKELVKHDSFYCFNTLRFIINGGGGQMKWGRGGFKDFDKLLNRGVKINGGWEYNIKEKRWKLDYP